MTKPILRIAVLFLATIGFNVAVAETTFQLRCRGPLTYAVGTAQKTTVVYFVKNASAAGEAGISLLPGTCAWADRPLASGEPSKIYLKPDGLTRVLPAFTAFTACAGDSRCVVEFLARNAAVANDPHLRVDDPYIKINYPAFPK